jgi:pimeloyl-ACP methyl ester carboxylesterase
MEPTEHRVNVNDIDIAYLACGDDGPLALCLHGFPDSAWTWRHLLPELADAGFRAVAPWLRGYAPTGLDAQGRYQNGASVADAVALHETLGGDDSAVIIGHDWGARIATGAAVVAPERWSKLVTAAVPPSGAVAQGFLTYGQLKRSWYMFFFQNPLAELVVSMNDLEFIDRLWEDWSPGYDASADLPRVKDALRDPANLAAAIEYYRATLNPAEHTVPELQAQEDAIGGAPPQPHLYLHGNKDGCMGVEIAHLAAALMTTPGSLVEIVEDAGHFLHLEQPKLVNRSIIDFLT